jgi:hypothetical protein
MFFGAIALFAQPVIQFEKTTLEFGNVKEEGGKVTGKFEFTNTGDKDLILTTVKPGCGCTATDYTKTPIAPGQKGTITASYDPYNRPGPFYKNIKVSTNEPKFEDASNTPYTIYIKGHVEKRELSKFEIAGYKNGTGNIRIKDNNVKIDLLNTETKTFTIQVMNLSSKESTFETVNFPNYITVEQIKGSLIKPNEEKEIIFKYDAIKRGEFGGFKDVLYIQTKDSIEPKLTLFVESTIKEDFSKLTPKQLQDAPKASLDSLNLNFRKVERNTTPALEMKLYNKGKNPLIIRQLKSNNTVFSVVSDKNEVAKDSFATLTVTFNSKNRRGTQNASIDIVTNDPVNTQMQLNCKGEISQ